ncbi:MAG: GDSL-type esterase/lipase family protein [Candidatus Magasanikbacteria bacterium]
MKTRICIFGASTTWGMRDNEGGGWVGRLRKYFETNNYDTRVYNLGIPGDTTTDLLKRFEVECEARKPDVIIFGIGANDACYINTEKNMMTSLRQFNKNFSKLIKKAKKITNKIILVGLTKVEEIKSMPILLNKQKFCSNANIIKYDLAINEAGKIHSVPFISLIDLLTPKDLSDDGRHPNSKGHEKMFLKIKDYLLVNKIV